MTLKNLVNFNSEFIAEEKWLKLLPYQQFQNNALEIKETCSSRFHIYCDGLVCLDILSFLMTKVDLGNLSIKANVK